MVAESDLSGPVLDRDCQTVHMPRVIIAVVILAMTVYCATEVMQADRDGVRHLAKWLWFIVVLILPVIGPALWLLFGRPTADSVDDAPDRRPLGPEDDPDFLRRL